MTITGNKGGDFTSSLDARGGTNSAGASANLVAMLHSLSTRFAPGMGDLRDGLKSRAYEEIRRRDAPLFEHLSAVFPGRIFYEVVFVPINTCHCTVPVCHSGLLVSTPQKCRQHEFQEENSTHTHTQKHAPQVVLFLLPRSNDCHDVVIRLPK